MSSNMQNHYRFNLAYKSNGGHWFAIERTDIVEDRYARDFAVVLSARFHEADVSVTYWSASGEHITDPGGCQCGEAHGKRDKSSTRLCGYCIGNTAGGAA